MPRTRKPLDVAAKTAELDAMIAASAARDEPAIVPPLAAEAEPAKAAGKPATLAAKQVEAKKPGRSSRKPAARATASRKAASGKAAKPARKAAKQGKAPAATKTGRKAKAPATAGRKAASGEVSPTFATIHRLMQRKDGCNEREVCEALGGWKKAGATISRAIKAAPFAVRKERVDGRTRYFAG
jgi:hypothetical protein